MGGKTLPVAGLSFKRMQFCSQLAICWQVAGTRARFPVIIRLAFSRSLSRRRAFQTGSRNPLSPVHQLWNAASTILNISRMNDDAQQEAQCVDQNVPLATFDLLARVVA